MVAVLAACGHGPSATGADGARADTRAPIDAPAGCVAADAELTDAGAAAIACTANGIPGACIDVAACIGSRAPTAGICAGPANIQCCTPRFAADITCDPNAHPEPDACLAEEPGDAGCPAGMARVDAFCVDRFEASLVDANGAPWSP